MLTHKSEFYLSTMCRVLNVSRSSFYYWLNGSNNRHLWQQVQQSFEQQVALAFQAEKSRSGAIRLVRRLSKMGLHYNRKTVASSWNDKDYGQKRHGNSKPPHKVTIICRWQKTCWNRTSMPISRIKNGSETSRTCGLMKAGSIWPSWLICNHAKWLVGRCQNEWPQT